MSGISILSAEGLAADICAGDRFVVDVPNSRDALVLPATATSVLNSVDQLQAPQGRPLDFQVQLASHRLHVPQLSSCLPADWDSLWIEYLSSRRWRLGIQEASVSHTPRSLTTEKGLTVELDQQDWSMLSGASCRQASLVEFGLSLRAAELSTHGGFEKLICLPLVREMELLEHQIRTAKTVLQRFRGRAMLCDEVGLGKTIEAGLVASELHTRGLAGSMLVLTPPSLVEQWQGEMRRKFSLDFRVFDSSDFRSAGQRAWRQFDRVIVSMHTAKREPHRSAILARNWGLVIVDEAHHLRNRNTHAWQFVSELKQQFLLLLTATPVQNNLDELFSLVTLLEPALFSTSKQFRNRFVDRKDKRAPKNVDELHSLLGEVMIRNRRSTVGLSFTRRRARSEHVELSDGERRLYDDVTHFVRDTLRAKKRSVGLNRLTLLMLQMALGSSSHAAAAMLNRLAQQSDLARDDKRRLAQLSKRADVVDTNSKADRLLQLLDEFPDKVVIFTQFRATQEMLRGRLASAGHDVAMFHGSLSRMQKEAAIERFRGPTRLLLCTESGSEGRNLQVARGVCNFDLPWNPTKIEQRIGRLSRIGQQHDVHVFNLVATDTLEAAVLNLLDTKLSMFELVIGEIDLILGNLDEEREFQDVVADYWADSSGTDQFVVNLEEYGNRLLSAKDAYLEQRRRDDRLFGNRFAADAA